MSERGLKALAAAICHARALAFIDVRENVLGPDAPAMMHRGIFLRKRAFRKSERKRRRDAKKMGGRAAVAALDPGKAPPPMAMEGVPPLPCGLRAKFAGRAAADAVSATCAVS